MSARTPHPAHTPIRQSDCLETLGPVPVLSRALLPSIDVRDRVQGEFVVGAWR